MYIKKISDFKLNEVKATDGYFQNALEKDMAYLKSFDADRLVAGFLEVNNIKPKADKYPGWEVTEIRGHSLGHYMTAAAQGVASTDDMELKAKLDYIVDRLAEAQMPSGYLSAFSEVLFENVENKKPCWVPWYTMDKIIAGLTAVYRFTGNEKALDVVSKLGDWVYSRISKWDEATQATVLAVEYGGMNEAMYDLYSITKSEKHEAAAHSFDEMPLFQALYDGQDILNGKHANTTIPKFLGALYRYIVRGCKEEDSFYLESVKNFWDIVVANHTYITGGNSEWEHFGESRVLDAERTNCNCETCNTYNMLKLSRELFKLTLDKKYADFYENTFMNAIMSSQNPETGMTMYFQPMATGYFKVYGTPFNSFWCCTGTGMENFTKLQDSMYFLSDDTVYVNQFVSSDIQMEGFSLKMESSIPDAENVKITVMDNTAGHKLAVRVPDWCAGEMHVKVSDNAGNVKLDISWNDKVNGNGYGLVDVATGDLVELVISMEVVAYPLHDNIHCVGFKYGPVVLSAVLGTEDMEESKTGVDVTIATRNISMKDFITIADGDVDGWIANVKKNVVKTPGKVEFKLLGTDMPDLTFTTHYKQHKERYGIYWNMVGADSEALQKHIRAEKDKARRARVSIDSIPLGNDQYELLHNIKGENTGAGTYGGLQLRHAWSETGWFSYDMKVEQGVKNYLLAKYFGPNQGRTFNIYIDDKLLIEETIQDKNHGDFYDEYYELTDEFIAGKDTITVKFAVRGDSWVGALFDKLSIVRDYSDNAELKSIDVRDGKLYVEPSDVNGLVYVNDILIDNTQPRDVSNVKSGTTLTIKSVAEDFKTEKIYTIEV